MIHQDQNLIERLCVILKLLSETSEANTLEGSLTNTMLELDHKMPYTRRIPSILVDQGIMCKSGYGRGTSWYWTCSVDPNFKMAEAILKRCTEISTLCTAKIKAKKNVDLVDTSITLSPAKTAILNKINKLNSLITKHTDQRDVLKKAYSLL